QLQGKCDPACDGRSCRLGLARHLPLAYPSCEDSRHCARDQPGADAAQAAALCRAHDGLDPSRAPLSGDPRAAGFAAGSRPAYGRRCAHAHRLLKVGNAPRDLWRARLRAAPAGISWAARSRSAGGCVVGHTRGTGGAGRAFGQSLVGAVTANLVMLIAFTQPQGAFSIAVDRVADVIIGTAASLIVCGMMPAPAGGGAAPATGQLRPPPLAFWRRSWGEELQRWVDG